MATGSTTLKDLLNTLDKEVRTQLLFDTRKLDLDKRPHVLDISYTSLLVNNKENLLVNFDQLHKTFIEVVAAKATRKYSSISLIPPEHFLGSTPYLVYIDGGKDTQLLLAMSYDAIQKFIRDVVRDPKLVDTAFGIKKIRKPDYPGEAEEDWTVKQEISLLDIGHIPSNASEYFVSPLAEKIGRIADILEVRGYTKATTLATDMLDEIMSIQADFNYSFRNSTPEVFKGVEKLFGTVFVAVTIQRSEVNQKDFGARELKIFQKFQENLAILLADKKLVQKYLGVSGSNTILQDIGQAVVSLIKTGKVKLKPHAPQKGPKGKSLIIGTNNKLPASTAIKEKLPRPAAVKEQKLTSTVSLAKLLLILNQQLQDVISANMGNGNRRDILNYRTGRLAGSAKVDSLSQSRQGMITAFYTYMKSPYATFSQGGRQELPKSRDPKLLISASIREIAAQQVTNRLRAVLV
jgi:hypothetical protein